MKSSRSNIEIRLTLVRKVLLAVDGSEHSDRALAWYAANINSHDDELLLVHVREAGEGDKRVAELADSVSERCAQLKIRAATRFVHKPVRNNTSAGAVIAEAAKEMDASLIIIGSRGLGAIKRTFLGSVSDYVLHHAHRPVLVIPPCQPVETL